MTSDREDSSKQHLPTHTGTRSSSPVVEGEGDEWYSALTVPLHPAGVDFAISNYSCLPQFPYLASFHWNWNLEPADTD